MPDPAVVKSLFGRIAGRYDLANRVLSLGIDGRWRRHLVAAVNKAHPIDVLDLATGSGDVALALGLGLPAGARILGMDFCVPMLEEANVKKAKAPGAFPYVNFRQGDALNLPLPDASYDAITLAFGFRNMADRARCLSEMHRVLRPGGSLFILEFSQPWRWIRPLYSFHLKHVVPIVAGILTHDRSAYDYLAESIDRFPEMEGVSREIERAGFTGISASAMTMGIVALHVARR
jgi:demethylmenaquinone methyltransferase / 2-methoxy-6-polyprenyl-1,4-benzoquinol methylase